MSFSDITFSFLLRQGLQATRTIFRLRLDGVAEGPATESILPLLRTL